MNLVKCIEQENNGTGAFSITNGIDRYTCRYEHRSGTGENKMPARWVVSLDGHDGEETLAMPKADVVAILEERLTGVGKKYVTGNEAVAVVAISLDVFCSDHRNVELSRMAAEMCGIPTDDALVFKMRIVALDTDTNILHVRIALCAHGGF